ncbi:Cellobiose 2-epimerase [Microbulbifer aggregans]|uniref:Cellobiose 2-epimerase n=2 Tax=Microbulbifer aggregans TaxID=1769779 RepID=A0A1C9WBW7_9GAMM|nr:Cellobiose 2-epimerase [Microbulbifer aggregans]
MQVTRVAQSDTGLTKYLPEFRRQLILIGEWWKSHSVDEVHGGFLGEVCAACSPVPQADKGIVLNARILWFFSELCLQLNEDPEADRSSIEEYRTLATRAYDYLATRFNDLTCGGAFWSLDCTGKVKEGKKQTYAQAFSIYAYASYYRLTGDTRALDLALSYFRLIEQHCVDRELGGYLEAVTREWKPVTDYRLSDKDLNVPKTMNNHLHVLEAYTALYRISPNEEVAIALKNSIDWFCGRIFNQENGHLRLFLEHDWRDVSASYSYGHDIEASWLLAEALEVLGDTSYSEKYRATVEALGRSCVEEGIGCLGQVLDTFDFETRSRHLDSEWWVQAEALVGFLNMWQTTGEARFKTAFENVWTFIKNHQIDWSQGEWLYYAAIDRVKAHQGYKLGFWKGPYHNGRAMMEVLRRLESIGTATTTESQELKGSAATA